MTRQSKMFASYLIMWSSANTAFLLLGLAGCCQRLCSNWADIWAIFLAEKRRAPVPDGVLGISGILFALAASLLGHEVRIEASEPSRAARDGRCGL